MHKILNMGSYKHYLQIKIKWKYGPRCKKYLFIVLKMPLASFYAAIICPEVKEFYIYGTHIGRLSCSMTYYLRKSKVLSWKADCMVNL